jgi:hypothetical protein
MCTTLCEKVVQLLATGQWFILDEPLVSFTEKTDSHNNLSNVTFH